MCRHKALAELKTRTGASALTDGSGVRAQVLHVAAQDPIMLGIIAKLKNMISDLVEAKLLIKGHGPGIVLPDAKPNLIRVASRRGGKQLGHEHLSDTFAMPPLIYINALDFGWSRRL